jgi:hypothetical protein
VTGARTRALRALLLVLAYAPVVLLAMRLDSFGPVPWFYDWPFVVAMLLVSLVANHALGRVGLPEGATLPHWADSAALHEATQKFDADLERPEISLTPPMSDEEVRARLEALSHRADQLAAIAESEALLRQHFENRREAVFAWDRKRRRGLRRRGRIANVALIVLLGLGVGWVFYLAYFN